MISETNLGWNNIGIEHKFSASLSFYKLILKKPNYGTRLRTPVRCSSRLVT